MNGFDTRVPTGILTLTALLALPVLWVAADARPPRPDPGGSTQVPEGVTPERIAEGKKLFAGEGECATCHGEDAKGVPGMTDDLTDGEWSFAEKGAYAALVKVTTEGLSEEQTGGLPMPPRGGKKLSDGQIAALAAYVWSLSHKGS